MDDESDLTEIGRRFCRSMPCEPGDCRPDGTCKYQDEFLGRKNRVIENLDDAKTEAAELVSKIRLVHTDPPRWLFSREDLVDAIISFAERFAPEPTFSNALTDVYAVLARLREFTLEDCLGESDTSIRFSMHSIAAAQYLNAYIHSRVQQSIRSITNPPPGLL